MERVAEDLNLAVVGAGYVGLVTAACLTRMGHSVVCVDRHVERIAELRRGVVPFREPGLDEAVAAGLASGRLAFADDLAAVRSSAAVIIAVGTLDDVGEWTATNVEQVVLSLAADRDAPRAIIVRSTLLPGTTARLVTLATAIDVRIDLVFNPEFTREGNAVRDFLTPDRTVIGATRPAASSPAVDVVRRTYARLSATVVVTDATSAELIKFAANVFLATKVGFANELARLSEAVGADVAAVVDAIGLDSRIGRAFLSPGPGFGGSCLPAQARALPELARTHGAATPILAAVAASNAAHPEWLVDRFVAELGGANGANGASAARGARVALLGLTFKAGTDDLRESKATTIARLLHAHGAVVVVHDPLALDAGAQALRNSGVPVVAAEDLPGAFDGARAVIVATEWPAYATIDWHAARAVMTGDLVFDTRGIVDAQRAEAAGLRVVIHGRAAAATLTDLPVVGASSSG